MFVVTLISFLLFDAVCCSGQWNFIEKQLQPMEKWFFKINWENQNTGVTAYVYFIHILDYLHSTFTQLCGFQKRKKTFHYSSSAVVAAAAAAASCWCVDFFFQKKKHQFAFGRIFIGRYCEIVGVRLIAFHCRKVEKHSAWIRFDLIPRFSGDTKRKKTTPTRAKMSSQTFDGICLRAKAKQQYRLNTLETSENTADDLF